MFGPAGSPVLLLHLRHALVRQHRLRAGRGAVGGAAAGRRGRRRASTSARRAAPGRPSRRRPGPRAGPAGALPRARRPSRTASTCATRRRRCGSSLPSRRARGRRRPAPGSGIAAAAERPWRFWLAGEPTVSVFTAGGAQTARRADRQTERRDRASPHPPIAARRPARGLRGAGLRRRADPARRRPGRAAAGRAHASSRPLRVKLGIDPSGTDLTLGHAVVLRKLRQFQDFGHTAVLVVGGFTGQVGDPSGRTATRAAQSAERRDRQRRGLLRPADADPRPRAHRGRQQRRLAGADEPGRDARLHPADDGRPAARARRLRPPVRRARSRSRLSEFFYPLLQGIDSVEIRADIELGGTDQTFNNLVGRELQRSRGQAPQAVLTVPLLVGTDGVEKMGKSLGNYIAIAEPAERAVRQADEHPGRGGRAVRPAVHRPAPARGRRARGRRSPRAAPRPTGPSARWPARSSRSTTAPTRRRRPRSASTRSSSGARCRPTSPSTRCRDGDPVHLPAVLVAAGLAASTSAARRDIDAGAVRIDGVAGRGASATTCRGPSWPGGVLTVGKRRGRAPGLSRRERRSQITETVHGRATARQCCAGRP